MKAVMIIGTAELNKEIALIKTAGKKLDDRIQHAGLSVINHAHLHGDVTVVNTLFLALPQGARAKALAEWLLAFGNVAKNTDKKSAKLAPFVYDKARTVAGEDLDKRLSEAAGMPWFKFAKKGDDVDSAYDLAAALKAMLARVDSTIAKGGKVEGMTDDKLAQLRLLAA